MRMRRVGLVFVVSVSLLLVAMFGAVLNVPVVRASGTIYIRADGSIDPPDAPISTVDNATYTLTGNITSDGDGIVVERSNIIIDGNGYMVQGTGALLSKGIHLSSVINARIKDTNIKGFDSGGVYLESTSYSTITENNITANNGNGIALSESSYNTVSGNNITANDGSGVGLYGFYVRTKNNTISGNQITNNYYGVYLDYSSSNSISGNKITNNKCGIGLFEFSNNNKIYHNNFIFNDLQATTYKSNNTWDDGYPSGGNYWSDYTDIDADGDGIGDTPYVIDADNKDHYPLMHPWSTLPVHNINTGLGYATIQEAINAPETLDGHTIFVEAGTYYENVIVNKTVSLIGENRDTTIIDGGGTGNVVYVEATEVNIRAFTIQHGTGGVVNWGGFAIISNNTITQCNYGIYFERTAYSPQIVNNTISSNGYGISLPVNSYSAAFYNNKVVENNYGISIRPFAGYASDTIISENVITNNRIGIELWSSDSGTIIGNYIANNTDYGVDVNYCTNNEIYHNNFINNGIQAHSWAHNSQNFWDDGYPSGGNYWSDYVGVDVKKGSGQNLHGSDGLGDTPYIIDANNTDRFPLSAPINVFDAGVWNGIAYNVDVVSNSTVSDFHFNPDEGPFLRFNVTGPENTTGFCRVTIPKSLLWTDSGWTINVNNDTITKYGEFSDDNNTYLYFTFNQTTKTVEIHGSHVIPEFPQATILPLFMIFILVVSMFRKKREMKHPKCGG